MIQEINANLLAQMANGQMEEIEVSSLLNGLYAQMPCDDPERKDYDRLFAANRLDRANESLLKKFKAKVYELMKSPRDNEARTMIIGPWMVKLYYNISQHFERVHLPELTDEQLDKMTDAQREKEGKKRDLLDELRILNERVSDKERELSLLKLEVKGINEQLALLMPDSKAIKYTPVVQVCAASL